MTKKQLIGTIVFNLVETLLIFGMGLFAINLSMSNTLTIALTFMVTRGICKNALHFSDWKRCLIWSLLILTSLFLTSWFSLVQGVLFAILSAFIMTGKSSIQDMYLWKSKTTKYNDIEEYILFNKNTDKYKKIIEEIGNNSQRDKLVFEARFIEKLTFAQIEERYDIPTQRLTVILDDIANTIRIAKNI